MSVLDVRNLSVQYLTENGASEIIKDISFKVEKGEIAGLVGESGSGKSTAMLAVMGLGDRAVIRGADHGQQRETCAGKKCGNDLPGFFKLPGPVR